MEEERRIYFINDLKISFETLVKVAIGVFIVHSLVSMFTMIQLIALLSKIVHPPYLP